MNLEKLSEENSMSNIYNQDDVFMNSVQEETDISQLWKVRTQLNEESLVGAIEAIIFMSEKPIGLERICEIIDPYISKVLVLQSIHMIQKFYETKQHGIRLVEVAEGYQFRTKAQYGQFIQNLYKVNSLVLSPSTLEVLAMIAYKQPISKVDIEKLRGVDSSHLIRTLMDKKLVRIIGRSDAAGRPTLYGTTQEFLEVFSLSSLEDLPPEYELEELAQKKQPKGIDLEDFSQFQIDTQTYRQEDEMLFQELQACRNISVDTEFLQILNLKDSMAALNVERKDQDSQKNQDFQVLDSNESQNVLEKAANPLDEFFGKTAFELMDTFYWRQKVREENIKSAESLFFPDLNTEEILTENISEDLSEEKIDFDIDGIDQEVSLSEEEQGNFSKDIQEVEQEVSFQKESDIETQDNDDSWDIEEWEKSKSHLKDLFEEWDHPLDKHNVTGKKNKDIEA
jgi:segregation and condensation protein B